MLVPAIAVTPIEIIVDPNGWNQRFETRIGFIITGLVLLVVVPTALAIAWNRVPRVVFCDEPFQEDTGDRNWHSRIRVRNDSGKSLECSVSLETADPPLPHCPIPLHCMHRNRPNSNVVTLDPDQKTTFDVCRIMEKTRKLEITGSGFEGEIPLKKYTVTIAIFAKDCPPERKQFVIEPRLFGARITPSTGHKLFLRAALRVRFVVDTAMRSAALLSARGRPELHDLVSASGEGSGAAPRCDPRGRG